MPGGGRERRSSTKGLRFWTPLPRKRASLVQPCLQLVVLVLFSLPADRAKNLDFSGSVAFSTTCSRRDREQKGWFSSELKIDMSGSASDAIASCTAARTWAPDSVVFELGFSSISLIDTVNHARPVTVASGVPSFPACDFAPVTQFTQPQS